MRLKLDDIARRFGIADLAPLYDAARRRDNLLNELYQMRAESLATQLRGTRRAAAVSSDEAGGGVVPLQTEDYPQAPNPATAVTMRERALLARFRAMGEGNRAVLLRLAVRLADAVETARGAS